MTSGCWSWPEPIRASRPVVYTAIAGGFDALRFVPVALRETCDFYCFSPEGLRGFGWTPIMHPLGGLDARLYCRVLKARPDALFPTAPWTLWIDGNISLSVAAEEWFEAFNRGQFGSVDALVAPHPTRASVREELAACAEQGKAGREELTRIRDLLDAAAFHDDVGLSETNVLFRRNQVSSVVAAMVDWESIIRNCCIRDQLSFDYVCTKHGVKVERLPTPVHGANAGFRRGLHVGGQSGFRRAFAYCEAHQFRSCLLKVAVDAAYRARS